MKFKIDENLPVDIAELLRKARHDAVTILDQGLGGKDDHLIIEACKRENRVLITLDTDFADIRNYPPQKYKGFIVLRTQKQDKQHIIDLFKKTIQLLEKESIVNNLWIVEETRVRIRG